MVHLRLGSLATPSSGSSHRGHRERILRAVATLSIEHGGPTSDRGFQRSHQHDSKPIASDIELNNFEK
jgi:hypothetical protein